MRKMILITGATDGIGLETARLLAGEGHRVLLHGRSPKKLQAALETVSGDSQGYLADLSRIPEVIGLAEEVAKHHSGLDVLINNAGVFATATPVTAEGLDIRFVVNAMAPYLLTQRLLPLFGDDGRVVNLSSAAQAPVDLKAMAKAVPLSDMAAYSQSKLAITAWSRHMAAALGDDGPVIVSVNPGSLLATKMVKEAFGMAGSDVGIGADILFRAALSDEFAQASGRYFDNDARRFADPHPDALNEQTGAAIVAAIEACLADLQA